MAELATWHTDPLLVFYAIGLFVFAPAGLFVAYMARRQRLREEADEDEQPIPPMAE